MVITTSEDYIFKVLEPLNEISSYSLTYKKGETSIFVSVHFNYSSTDIMQMNNGQKAEKINIITLKLYIVSIMGWEKSLGWKIKMAV